MDIGYREIKDFPGYRVGNDGSAWSRWHSHGWLQDEWRQIKAGLDKDGYLMVGLYRDRKRYTRKIHRLVLEAFVGPCPVGMECCHLDDNPSNNVLGNLKWGTRKENESHKASLGGLPLGSKRAFAKLKEADIPVVKELYKLGWTQRRIAKRFDVSQSIISYAINGKTWAHVPN